MIRSWLLLLGPVACARGADAPARLAPPATPSTEARPVAEDALPSVALGPPVVVAEARGLRLLRQPYAFGAQQGLLFVAEGPRDAALDVVPHPTVQPFDRFLPAASDKHPWAAINGGFYHSTAKDGMSAMGLVVSDGAIAQPWSKGGGSGVVTYGPGPARVLHRSDWSAGPREALQSIDRIVDGGESLVTPRPGKRAAARSAVAIGADHVWLVAAVDQSSAPQHDAAEVHLRSTIARGLPLWAFADALVQLGATEALNLDGAISTSMAARLGAEAFLLQGEAGTINALVLRPPPAAPPPP